MHNSNVPVAGSLVLTSGDYIVPPGALTPGDSTGMQQGVASLLPGNRSIAVMVGLERSFLRDVDVGGLFRRQFRELNVQFFQLQAGHVLV